MALKSSEILGKWRIICDSMDYNSVDAVSITFKQWKDYLLTSVSKESDKTMLMSSAQNNNIRVFTFLMNELHELNPFKKSDDKQTELALELAIKHGNYTIARELLTRNQQLLKVNAAIKSPVYYPDAKYLRDKMNVLLKEFNQFTWVEYEDLDLMIEEQDTDLVKTEDKYTISIDIMSKNSIFFALLNNKAPLNFQYDKMHRFYYYKYIHTGEILMLTIIFTTPLIEALELNNQEMINYFIENKIIYPYDREYISQHIAKSKICDSRIFLYKETLAKLNEDEDMKIIAVELKAAIKKGNFTIAKKLLSQNQNISLLPLIKSPIYHENSKYLIAKMNLLLRGISRVEFKNLHVKIEATTPAPDDKYIISIDKMDESSIFYSLLNNKKPVKFKYYSKHRFYYIKYEYTANKLKPSIIFTTPLIEALELDNQELINYFIETKVIYAYDQGYISGLIASKDIQDTRISLYKDILSKII